MKKKKPLSVSNTKPNLAKSEPALTQIEQKTSITLAVDRIVHGVNRDENGAFRMNMALISPLDMQLLGLFVSFQRCHFHQPL